MGLNKAELIESIAAEAKISKADAKRALDAFVTNTTKLELSDNLTLKNIFMWNEKLQDAGIPQQLPKNGNKMTAPEK